MKIIYGNEPYLIERYKKHYADMVTHVAFNLSILYGKYTPEVNDLLQTYPVMDDKRVVILVCDTLKDLEGPLFYAYLDAPTAFSEFLVIVKNVDSRLKIYKRIQAAGVLQECNKFNSPLEFNRAVRYELAKLGAQISDEAVNDLCRQIGYFEIDHVSFLEVLNVLRSLSALSKNITSDMVKQHVPENKEANLFMLAELIRKRDMGAIKEQIMLIAPSDTILVLSVLLREFRIAYKASMYPMQKIGVKRIILSNIAPEVLLSCISLINGVIIKIKTGKISVEYALAYVCFTVIHELKKES